jgi:hypothetical protein
MSTALTTLTSKRGPKPKYPSLAAQIEALSVRVPFSGCWIWTGSVAKGYGQLTHKGKHMTAHRASFIAHNPQAESPKLVCHHCDVRECVNPDHLYSGDYLTNRDDMLKRGRWAHPYSTRSTCERGHNYEEGGYRIAADGSRVCKSCQREYKRAYRAAGKAV